MRTQAGTVVLVSVVAWCGLAGCSRTEAEEKLALQQGCLEAAKKGIAAEVVLAEAHLEGAKAREDAEATARIEGRLKKLREDATRYEKMKPEEYVPPEPVKVRAKLTDSKDGLLNLEQQMRIGPWYHVAGSRGEMWKDVMYEMTLYRVYRKEYFDMESWWVYVSEHKLTW